MSESPIPAAIRIAQVVGITSAAYLSGYIANFSVVGIPSLARAPLSVKPQVWQEMYRIGASTAPFFAILSSLAFSYLASRVSQTPEVFQNTILDSTKTFYLYSSAAILVPAIVPFTIGIMKPTNDKLHAKADKYRLGATDAKEDQELEDLLKKWTVMNTARSLFPLTAAIVGLWAVVS